MWGQREVQDLSAQNTISDVTKPDVFCNCAPGGGTLAVSSALNSSAKAFGPFRYFLPFRIIAFSFLLFGFLLAVENLQKLFYGTSAWFLGVCFFFPKKTNKKERL